MASRLYAASVGAGLGPVFICAGPVLASDRQVEFFFGSSLSSAFSAAVSVAVAEAVPGTLDDPAFANFGRYLHRGEGTNSLAPAGIPSFFLPIYLRMSLDLSLDCVGRYIVVRIAPPGGTDLGGCVKLY